MGDRMDGTATATGAIAAAGWTDPGGGAAAAAATVILSTAACSIATWPEGGKASQCTPMESSRLRREIIARADDCGDASSLALLTITLSLTCARKVLCDSKLRKKNE